jgi:hypothetical protein
VWPGGTHIHPDAASCDAHRETHRARIVKRWVGVDSGRDVVISGMSPPGEDVLRFFDEKGEVIHPVRMQVGAGYQAPHEASEGVDAAAW